MPYPYVNRTPQRTVYRPRMRATASIPYLSTPGQQKRQERSDEVITIEIPLSECEVEANDFHTADSCHIVTPWSDTLLDTRALDDAVITVYMGEADELGQWSPGESDVVFIGHLVNPERTLDSEGMGELRLECLDYTHLFLQAKPFGSAGIPRYSDTLEQAWRRVCSQTPGAGILADRLVFEGDIDGSALLSRAVSPRFAKLSQVPAHPDTDAFAVWLQCVGMLGCVSYIDRDECVVTTATDLQTEVDPPVLTFGQHITSLSESRQCTGVKGGVCLVSFDPQAGKTIEAFWPPINQVQRKLTAAAKKNKNPDSLTNERDKRQFFNLSGVTDPAMLLVCARRTHEQLSRQELQGKLSTPHMMVKRASGRDFNLVKLKAGDTIRVNLDEGLRQRLINVPGEQARAIYLQGQGYAPDVSRLLARSVESFAALGSTFYVASVRKRLSLDDAGGEFEIEISYMNKIDISRAAVGPEAT